jgi:DNA-binding NtrC family response regulator
LEVFREGMGEAYMGLPSVLVVGSDLECRRTLTDVLGLWGMEGSFVSTIAEARKTLLEQPVTLVFCESNLADGGLIDLVEAAASRRSPVRLVAILHDADRYSDAIREGAFEAVLVPCQRPDVQWAIIQATLAERRTPQEFEGHNNPGEDSVRGEVPSG